MTRKTLFVPTNHSSTIDLVRVFSIFLVVFSHTLETLVWSFPATQVDKCVYDLIHSFTFICVSLFFCISGYFLLNVEYDKKRTKNFYLRHVLPLLGCWEIWILLFNLIAIGNGTPFNAIEWIRQMFFITHPPARVDWFIPCILIVYLLTPLLSNGIRKLDLVYVIVITLIMYVFFFVGKDSLFNSYLNLSFFVYVFIGYIVRQLSTKNLHLAFKIVTPILIPVLFAGFAVWLGSQTNWFNNIYIPWYNCPFYAPIVFCIFMSIIMFIKIPTNGVCYVLGNCMFGLFLMHCPLIDIFTKIIHFDNLWLTFLVCFIAIYGISLVASICISFIPYASKILINAKTIKFIKYQKKEH